MMFKMSGQMALISKARFEGDLGDRHPFSKEALGMTDAHLGQIGMRWETRLCTKGPNQGERVELNNASKLL